MFHSTAWVSDYESARDKLMSTVGLRVLEDTRIEDPRIARRGGMTWIGDNSLELGQPILPGTATARFVERHGPGMHSIALQVDDLAATCVHLEAEGVRAVKVSEHIAFSHPADTGGVFIEWFSDEHDIDPHFGAVVPPVRREPLLRVDRMAFVGAVVEAPQELASRLARLLGTSITFAVEGAPPGAPHVGVSLGDCTLALYPLPGAASGALWGSALPGPRVHVLGLLVPDLPSAASALARAGIEPIRTEDHAIVLPPDATGCVPMVVTDRLCPGDPRIVPEVQP